MKRFRQAGWFLFLIGLALLSVLLVEEFSNNMNYYYYHQINFILLFLIGTVFGASGFWLLLRDEPEKGQKPSSQIK